MAIFQSAVQLESTDELQIAKENKVDKQPDQQNIINTTTTGMK